MTVQERAVEVIRLTLAGPNAGPLEGIFTSEDIARALADAGLLATDDDLAEFERARARSLERTPEFAAIARGRAYGLTAAAEYLESLDRPDDER